MTTRFKVVIPVYNAMPWHKRCLSSLASQTIQPIDVCIIDDASTQEGQREFIAEFCQKKHWNYIFNKVNQKALVNVVKGIDYLNPSDDEVILVLDGDDWLFNPLVLETIDNVYQTTDTLLTYGGQIDYRGGKIAKPFHPSAYVMKRRLFRKRPWMYGPPRTFKGLLWNNLDKDDLRDEDGEYYKVTYDQAFFLPMLEMAGERIFSTTETMYVYNTRNPINDFKVRPQEQVDAEARIRKKQPYELI